MLIQTKHSGYQNGIRLYRIGQGDSDSIGTDAAVASNAAADAAAAAAAAAGSPGGDNPFTRVSDAATRDIPVVDRTYGVGVGNTQYTPTQVTDLIRSELTANPNLTYWDALQRMTQRYGLSPQQLQAGGDRLVGSVTPYNAPPPRGGIYSFFPAEYQPVRYTPQYDQYGQGIASLFGRGYSQYFQPPGLTGNYFFGSQPGGGNVPGGGFTYVPPGGTGTIIGGLGNSTITGGGRNDTITGGGRNDTITGGTGNDTVVQIPAGFTAEQAARYRALTGTDRSTFAGLVNRFNAPGSVQSDAASIRAFMDENKLSVDDVARIGNWTPADVQSYLGQAGLTNEQLARYQTLGAADQSTYSKLAGFTNAPNTAAQNATQLTQFMQENKLTTADVSRLSGIPIDAVNAYVLQSSNTAGVIPFPAGQITTAPPPPPPPPPAPAPAPATTTATDPTLLSYVQANLSDPSTVYNATLGAGMSVPEIATALGVTETQVNDYFNAAGYGRADAGAP